VILVLIYWRYCLVCLVANKKAPPLGGAEYLT
jgi:hypothetical protein